MLHQLCKYTTSARCGSEFRGADTKLCNPVDEEAGLRSVLTILFPVTFSAIEEQPSFCMHIVTPSYYVWFGRSTMANAGSYALQNVQASRNHRRVRVLCWQLPSNNRVWHGWFAHGSDMVCAKVTQDCLIHFPGFFLWMFLVPVCWASL